MKLVGYNIEASRGLGNKGARLSPKPRKAEQKDSAFIITFEPLDPTVPEVHVPLGLSITLANKSSLCLSQLELS